MELSSRIRHARTRAHLSQQELADRLGISRTAVANWESAKPVFPATKRLLRIALLTCVCFEWLSTGYGPIQNDLVPDGTFPDEASEGVDDELEQRLLRAFRAASRHDGRRIIEFAEARTRSKL